MSFDEEEVTAKDREPGPDVTRKLFRQWQMARRGRFPAEDMTNPVWRWLFRGRVDPYHANERFKSRLKKMLGTIDFPNEPRWAGCRLGQSRTQLSDGRLFWIAGEHEDFYDPDFYIYNDVIVQQADGDTQIYGYPETSFRPTDFHSATLVNDEKTILLIGSIGYPEQRDIGRTPIYALDTENFQIDEIASTGNHPGWISKHTATLSEDESSIIISGGEVMTEDGLLESIDDWSLTLADFRWTRLTLRKWIRFQVGRADQTGLHLWNYDMRKFSLEHPGAGLDREDDLADEIGAEPNMEAYDALYKPPVPHSPVDQDPENEDGWRTKKVTIEGVPVRYTDEMEHLTVTIEGDLPKTIVDSLAKDLCSKLALVENTDCRIKWID
ncbi:hypothetical protein Enr13x_51640 [Stieleria neptunia]|uniref:Uncharacterized protein n=1 Tax=Stieleria neptunia TaxID=2527979 RepID=A0A518HWQ3_9BACT|nr:hypothetical protein [Stieleria neptunia]QDV45288.1 hypothetical protein Enr13x_51640 [Stieleria neptunia]